MTGPVSIRLAVGQRHARSVRIDAGVPGFAAGTDPRGAAQAFVAEFGDLFGVSDPQFVERTADALGHQRVSFSQRYRGLPVFGSSLRVHFDARGRLIGVHAAWVPALAVSVQPSFAEAEAEQAALQHVAGAAWLGSTALTVFDVGLVTKEASTPSLAYAVEVGGPGVDETVYVDAHSGAVLLSLSRVHTVLDRAVYDLGYGPAFLVWEEADGPYEGGDDQITDLIEFSEDTYELLNNISGGTYPSYDGASATMEAVARAPISCPNANWNGTSTNYCDGLAADDVVGHEWAHAYTMQTHGLIYAYQPGALNESYSDIFGESVDLLNGAGTDVPGQVRDDDTCSGAGGSLRWLMGEDTVGLGVIRDMWLPSCEGAPGHVGAGEYLCTAGFFDNGGVHINSGVPNHAYALLVDGGTYNAQAVASIGMTKALAIYWRAMVVYQDVVSGFADHADALEAACADLRDASTDLPSLVDGTPSGEVISDEDCEAVADALAATQMRDDAPCGSGTLLDTDDPPALCDEDAELVAVFSDDFEGDLSAWTLTNDGVSVDYTPRDWELRTVLPDDRAGQGVFADGDLRLSGCNDNDQSGVVHLDSPAIELPDGPGAVMLEFWHWVATEPSVDGGNIRVSVNGQPFVSLPNPAFTHNPYNSVLDFSSNPLGGQGAWSGSDVGVPTGSWAASHADLSGIADPGDSVVVRFDFGVDDCNGLFGWYLDDVRVAQCAVEGGTGTGPSTSTGTATGTGTDTDTDTGDTTTGNADTSSSGDPPASTTSEETTSGAPESTSGPTSAPPGGGTAMAGSDTDTDTAPDSSGGDDGCGCTHGSGDRGAVLLLLALFGVRRRRR